MPNEKPPAPAQHVRAVRSSKPLFQLGQVVATPAVVAYLEKHAIFPAALLSRHQHGDWGNVDADDAAANAQAVHLGARLLSSYLVEYVVVWVITEATDDEGKRASTCLLFPEEY